MIDEIKYTEEPFIIDKAYAEVLKNKMEVFREQTRSKKQLFISFVSVNGLKENAYSKELINALVTLEDFFK